MRLQNAGWMIMATVLGFCGGMLGAQLTAPASARDIPGERLPITTAGLTIINQEGKPRASLQLWDGEHPALVLSDAGCARRAELIVSPQEHTALTMFGKDCKRRVAIEVHADDLPSLVLRDQHDVPRMVARLLQDGSPVLDFLDANGKRIKSMP
jgi:hypothetical protein